MASILDLARCCKAVYGDLPEVKGWDRAEIFSSVSSGFFATLFTRSNEAVLAIRGTDELQDMFSNLQLFAGSLPAQRRPARDAVREALQITDVPIERFYLTGHSLGGGVAALKSARSTPPLPVVTFNSPGMYRAITQSAFGVPVYLYNRHGVREYRGSFRKAIHIRHQYDPVSRGTGSRIAGREITVANKECPGRTPLGYVSPAVGVKQSLNRGYCAHRMEILMRRLASDPRFAKEIDWSDA